MGCCITLHCMNQWPDLFHSILFGAGAMSPMISILEDWSTIGGINTIVNNANYFLPGLTIDESQLIALLATVWQWTRDLWWGTPKYLAQCSRSSRHSYQIPLIGHLEKTSNWHVSSKVRCDRDTRKRSLVPIPPGQESWVLSGSCTQFNDVTKFTSLCRSQQQQFSHKKLLLFVDQWHIGFEWLFDASRRWPHIVRRFLPARFCAPCDDNY